MSNDTYLLISVTFTLVVINIIIIRYNDDVRNKYLGGLSHLFIGNVDNVVFE